MKPISVNVISESEFTVQGHGVHTAYLEHVSALRSSDNFQVYVNSSEKTDICHIHTVGPYSLAKLLRSNNTCVTAHVIPDSFIGSFKGAKHWYKISEKYLRFFYERADHVVAVSQMVADSLKHDIGITKNVSVVPNAINIDKIRKAAGNKHEKRSKLGIDQSAFVVVSVGQIQPRKRFDVFHKMAKDNPKMQFIWVGGMPFKKLGANSKENKQNMTHLPDNLLITGVIPLEQVYQYYSAADVFVLPSNQENHPLAVLEAAACGLPIILRDIPEYKDAFGGDVIYATDKTFSRKLVELSKSAKLQKEYSQKAKDIAERFGSQHYLNSITKIYTKIIEDKA